MGRTKDKIIVIQRIDEETETWSDVWTLHARINKARVDSEVYTSGSIKPNRELTFDVRYFKGLEDVDYNSQNYRIIYDDHTWDIFDYDDYWEQHKEVRLRGVSQ